MTRLMICIVGTALLATGCDGQQTQRGSGSAHGGYHAPLYVPRTHTGIQHHETPHSAPPRAVPRTPTRITPVRPAIRPSFRGGGS